MARTKNAEEGTLLTSTADDKYELEIYEVNNKLEIENFVSLHEILYREDPLYVLPIRKEFKGNLISQLIKKEYDKPVIAYNVYVNNRISGRIWLTLFKVKVGKPGEKMQGVFNFFETIDDDFVSKALFDKAEQWFSEQGIDYYYGNTNPKDPDDARGVLIEGFEDAPTVMCIYNKAYYRKHFEQHGFKMNEDLLGYRFTMNDIPYQRYDVVEKLKKRYDFYVRNANKKNLESDAKDVLRIIDDSISDDWDFRAPEPDKVYELLKEWKNFLDFKLIKIAYTNDGRPIGFGMIVPNFNEALQKIKGHWNIISILRLLYYKNKITTYRAMIQMVVIDYQGKGVINAIYQDYFQDLKNRKVKMIDASTIPSDNLKSRYAIEKLGGKRYKVFRLYGIDVPLNRNDS